MSSQLLMSGLPLQMNAKNSRINNTVSSITNGKLKNMVFIILYVIVFRDSFVWGACT